MMKPRPSMLQQSTIMNIALALISALFLLISFQPAAPFPFVVISLAPPPPLLPKTKLLHSFALSSTSTNSNNNSNSNAEPTTKAGEEGYSILRQPLNWDAESDPRFEAPTSFDASQDSQKAKDAEWFQNRILGDLGASVAASAPVNDNENHNLEIESFTSSSSSSSSSSSQQQHRTEEFNQEINLFQRTMDTLDYPIVLKSLRQECSTKPAQLIITNAIDEQSSQNQNSNKSLLNKQKRRRRKKNHNNNNNDDNDHDDGDILAVTLTAQNVQGIHDRYDAIKEMNAVVNNQIQIPTNMNNNKNKNIIIDPTIPFHNCDFDIQPMLEKVDNDGVLDGPDILEINTILDSILKVGDWCMKLDDFERQRRRIKQQQEVEEGETSTSENNNNKEYDEYGYEQQEEAAIPLIQLPKFGRSIYIDEDLISLLENAFDDEGRLSGTTFPSIGRLRAKVRTLKNDILGTLETLMTSPSIKSKVSLESGGAVYSEVNGRIVIPIADKYRNSVGIIHDQSRSGKTAYVEPTEIVRPTNEMRGAEMELKQEEMKVWRKLTKEIKDNRDDIERSIAAVAQLDLVLARIRLGDKLNGVVPEVGDDGVISLQDAKHPVLLLRELDNVVGSDIDIGAGKNQGLVLTGPNSGGMYKMNTNLYNDWKSI